MTLNSAGIDPNNLNAVLGYVNEVEKQLIPLKNTIKIHFLRNFTIEPIAPFLKFHCYKAGIQPQLTYSDYGNLRQSILDSQSDLHCTQPDIIVLAQYFDSNDLFSQPWGDFESLSSEILGMLALLIEKTAATILVNTQLPHLWPHLTANTPESLGIASLFESLNPAIKSMAASSKSRIIVTDWERYLQRVGESEGLDSRYWYINKAPFKKAFLTNYAADIARVAKVQSGKLKKCLVLDCDNTLWGGIIGEDGLSGIKLDPNDYPGKIFYDFQQQILALYNRGVMICLCSKNNESDAMLVFDTHPGCVLKRQHLSAYRINWDDKATNITRLSQDLNIGLDSMVFIDDSGIECEWVKETLPQVTVLQVPKDLSQLPALLFKAHCFDTLSLSQEDKHRTQSYQQEQSRKESAAQFSDVEAYLASLQLELDIHECRPEEITRVAQLTQKTNQFNLSMRRYSEADITRLSNSPVHRIFVLWAKDRFGDYGLTGVIILENTESQIIMDSLLLSCRILSRRIEFAFLDHCISAIRTHENQSIQIPYVPTPRNAQVKKFLEACGCTLMNTQSDTDYFILDRDPVIPAIGFIQLKEPIR